MEHVPRSLLYQFFSLGCEMIFVIEQRLKDSQIEEERRKKVLKEIVERFLSEEEIYNLGNFKEQFTKIAHCTTMKLNPVSMAKLFDLMTMGKYEFKELE